MAQFTELLHGIMNHRKRTRNYDFLYLFLVQRPSDQLSGTRALLSLERRHPIYWFPICNGSNGAYCSSGNTEMPSKSKKRIHRPRQEIRS